MSERPPFDMSRQPPGRPVPTPSSLAGTPRSGTTDGDVPVLSPRIAAALARMTAPPAPTDLRARILAAHPFEGVGVSAGRGRILAFVGAAAAAAAVVFAVGGTLRSPARPALAWEELHPEAKSPPARVRVVNDPAPADWTSASIVNASLDPLDGP